MNRLNKLFSALILTAVLSSHYGLIQTSPALAAPMTRSQPANPKSQTIQRQLSRSHQPSLQESLLAHVKAAQKAIKNKQTSAAEQDIQAALNLVQPIKTASQTKPLTTSKPGQSVNRAQSTGQKIMFSDAFTRTELHEAYGFLKNGQAQKAEQALQTLESQLLANMTKNSANHR